MRYVVGAMMLCVALCCSGCAGDPLSTASTVVSDPIEKTIEKSGAANEQFADVDPTSADEYWEFADTSGEAITPEAGSVLRQELMDSARAYFALQTKFVVHSLTVQGEIAEGIIEPYPVGSDYAYATTWVLWKGSWNVVDAYVADANTVFEPEAASAAAPSAPTQGGAGSSPGDGGMTAEELRQIVEEQRAYEEEQARREEEQRLAQARADWDAYNDAYQAEYEQRRARMANLLASRGLGGEGAYEYNMAKIPAEMAADGWPAPGPRP